MSQPIQIREDELRRMHPAVAEAVMQTLDDETLQLMEETAGYEIGCMAERILRYRKKRNAMTSRRLNYPIDEVLDDYVNRRTGKLVEAKRQLRKRFDGLDHDKQVAVMMAFMEHGREAEREFICDKLYGEEFWTDAFIPLVEGWWERFHDRKMARVVIKRCPREYLLGHLEEFEGRGSYATLCIRTGISPDPSRLSPWTYLYVRKCIGGQMRFREGEETVLRAVRDYLYEDGVAKPVDSVFDIPYVRRMMNYLGEMGLVDDIMAIDAFDRKLRNMPQDKWCNTAIKSIEEEFDFPEYVFKHVK
jgi:hypothetical protein